MQDIQRVKTLTEYHRTRSLPPPEHPLISVVDYAAVQTLPQYRGKKWVLDFYLISLKKNFDATIRYGQQEYDFDEGVMFFIAPGQVFSVERDGPAPAGKSGWMLLIHPDFLWSTPLAKSIRTYGFFDYAIHEALFVSAQEESILTDIVQNIRQECRTNIDRFSQRIIHSQIETLLNYSERFYNRQFITRKKAAHETLEQLEALLVDYFGKDDPARQGLPTVAWLAAQLNRSPKYLSGLLKSITGQTAQQLIHEQLMEQAKAQLSTTHRSVSEIAYALGFEHPQSFSKLFKSKTALSPLEFRKSFHRN